MSADATGDLITDPPEVTLKASGDRFALQLINTASKKICFKVKSSNNELYRITPVYGLVDPGQGAQLSIERVAGAAKQDKLVVEYMYANDNPGSAEQFFKANPKKGSVSVKLFAQ